ncbi:GGDEF domain-containing protein, partial [Mycobacterium sp. ITM-2017-0098]
RLGSETNIATAVAAFWLIWFVNLTVPLAIRSMARAMGTYAARPHADPLTGLLNRRGFADAVRRRLTGTPDADSHLGLLMVDLDD